MTANERRKKIIGVLSERRHDTIMNLAKEFEVCRRTMIYDIYVLSLSYPIFTSQGVGGGVYVMDGARIYIEGRLSVEQTDLLRRIEETLQGKDLEIMKSILLKFGKPKKE